MGAGGGRAAFGTAAGALVTAETLLVLYVVLAIAVSFQ